ncbi:hypothetical protein [Parvularcula maris]|uniref:Uncharacterized protein n=1 Tax=Parvularcula maris TaxID=2965077 RepID=A0A9X2LB57_9PROT|nr:hypothetical protein [Parvularcula maris]MCQ8186505.1 hypothetical protein [Parvularcula maris]
MDAYEEAGGKVRRDLFGEEGDTLADDGLLTRLAEKKLQEIADSLRPEGWSWVLAMVEFDPSLHQSCYRVHPQLREVTGEAKEERDRLAERLKTLLDSPEGTEPENHDLSRAEWEEVEAIETRMDDIDKAHTDFTDEDKGKGGVVVHLDHRGKAKIVRGLVRRADDKTKVKKAEKPSVPTVFTSAAWRSSPKPSPAMWRRTRLRPTSFSPPSSPEAPSATGRFRAPSWRSAASIPRTGRSCR